MSKSNANPYRNADILVVDDTPASLHLLTVVLQNHGYRVRPVDSGEMALRVLGRAPSDMILLDVMMPTMDGYTVCEHIKKDADLADIPIIFISALDDTFDKVRAFQVGGVDFITKPFQNDEVLARIATHLELRQRRLEIQHLRDLDRQHFERLSKIKDEIVRTASHDLKSPLSVIMTATEMLRDIFKPELQTSPDMAEMAYYLERIEYNTGQMRRLITDLLDLARIGTGMALFKEILPINPLLRDVSQNFKFQAQEKNLKFTWDLPSEEVELNFDPERITQVLNNLLSNAIKYTPEGGNIRLWTETAADYFCINVQDTGRGIPADDQPYVFEAFYRVAEHITLDIEGTGLGLSIAKSIIEQHQGEIGVESEVGEGSQFCVRLPRLG